MRNLLLAGVAVGAMLATPAAAQAVDQTPHPYVGAYPYSAYVFAPAIAPTYRYASGYAYSSAYAYAPGSFNNNDLPVPWMWSVPPQYHGGPKSPW